MTAHNNNSWGLFSGIIGVLSTGLAALIVCAYLAQQVLAGAAADVTDIDLMNRSGATMTDNAAHKTVVQRAAAGWVQGNAKISIVNFAFAPAEITIDQGESVTWVNDDGAPHGLKFHDGAKGTDLLLPGSNFTRRFDRPATYDYECAVHPYMTGRVVVRAK
jgi:plastocyanin